MTWAMVITCGICGAVEHRLMHDDDEPTGHTCRAATIGEGLVTL